MARLSSNKFLAARYLEESVSQSFRDFVGTILNVVIWVVGVVLFYQLAAEYQWFRVRLYQLPASSGRIGGILLILGAVRFFLFMVSAFYNSRTYDKSGNATGSLEERADWYVTEFLYSAGAFYHAPSARDIILSFADSSTGISILARMGIGTNEYRDRMAQIASTPTPGDLLLDAMRAAHSGAGIVTMADIVTVFHDYTPVWHDLLIEHDLTLDDALGAARWVVDAETRSDTKRRWWLKERMARQSGMAKDWAYGFTPTLDRFSENISEAAMISALHLIGKEHEIKLLEAALLRTAGANAVIVGPPGIGKHTLLWGITKMIARGEIFPELEHKQVFLVSGPTVASSGGSKVEVESIIIQMMNEAVKAGNIILAIDDFPDFIRSLESLDVRPLEILGPYLEGGGIHIIALSNTDDFHMIVEQEHGLMKYFEKVEVTEPDRDRLIEILQTAVPFVEQSVSNSPLITYPALKSVAESAIRYLTEGVLPERALTLLDEAERFAAGQRVQLLTGDIVLSYVREKTNMPIGALQEGEQDVLLRLEEELHKRVIGQDEAIRAIANAVRRARADIGSKSRPIGTFLFLGPTGVGKTETAKAFAAVYFGNEESMTRFDMTEYQDENALDRLIGSFSAHVPGVLTNAMHSHAYSVVLLDEFEKAHPRVNDLFLQILDEGFYTDALGEKINMRNTIIIATSNAGAPMILDLVASGAASDNIKEQIISHIISEGIFKPELLNRFDETIVFHSLTREELREVARLMIAQLQARLQSQNIFLGMSDDLLDFAVEGGYDALFGARPMRRFIQDSIERVVAEKILNGSVPKGKEFFLQREDLV
jgi:ATP-dependent Clp protease ATP-binding subunit ClpA